MSTPIGPLLRDLAADVPEPDLAELAWTLAARRITRRRRIAAAAVAAAATIAVIVAGISRLSPPSATPLPGREGPTAPYRPTHAVVDGVTVDLAPGPAQEAQLPAYPDVADIALPERLGFAADAALPTLSGIGALAQPVRAVLLRRTGSGGYLPVLYVPDRTVGRYVEVDSVTLAPLVDANGYSFAYLGPSTIATDRHRLAFVQPGAVVVVDPRDGSVHRWVVPDPGLESGGWALDGVHVIVTGRSGTWRVDARTGSVARAGGAAFPGRARLVTLPGGAPALQTARADGAVADTRDVPDAAMGWWAEPVTNLEGWSVSGAFYPTPVQDVTATYQGLYAVQFDVRAHARLLAAPDVPEVAKGAYVARGWAPQDVVLFSSTSLAGSTALHTVRLLAWDLIDGRMWRVSDIGPVSSQRGGFSGDFALSP